MEFEYWQLLLLPFFFALGWLAARIDIRHVVRDSRVLPRAYFQGLNFLLNREPDKAIQSFLAVSDQDASAIELNFALGGLFRRRGEIGRGIALHEALIERDDVDAETRLQARSELGQDYLCAGLLDRAEPIFTGLLDTSLKDDAKRQLLEIYQQEKDWARAIAAASELPDLDSAKKIAQFHCEQAEGCLARGQAEEAAEHAKSALAANRRCVRATLMQGDLAARAGDDARAIAIWQGIEAQDADYLALAAERLRRAYLALGKPEEGLALLSSYLDRYPAIDHLENACLLAEAAHGQQAAVELVRAEITRHPSLLALEKFIAARLPLAAPEFAADLELSRQIVADYTRRLARYRCASCGFMARRFQWRCPACGQWESWPPRRAEELETILL
jgi:lipopolysaccharide biosynthesis regulator YciM